MPVSLTTPNDIFYKGRLALVTSSALLLLAIYVGLSSDTEESVNTTQSAITILSFELDNTDALPIILLLATIYSAWRFLAAWYVQSEEVRDFPVNKADCVLTGAIAVSSIASFFFPFPAGGFWGLFVILVVIWYAIFFAGVERLGSVMSKRAKTQDERISEILTSQEWELLYDPIRSGVKDISFQGDGEISEGRNQNEDTWRVREGLLEILRDTGDVQSRFRYDGNSEVFEHTNEDDTLSKRHQVIRKKNAP